MLFNSFQFLIFFPIVTIIYFLLPHRYRWALILSASCYFYMAFVPKYIFILGVTITIDYFAGLGLEKFKGNKRKWLLVASIISNIGMLSFFKYFNFANENITSLANFIGWNYPIEDLSIILPIGLSFHTFQSLSYTIEVYKGKFKAERHFGYLATYVMFYPQLVAGPIERPQNVIPQFHKNHPFEYQRVTDGLKWMAWGMFKKVVIADRMALFVNPVYSFPGNYDGPALLVATLAFAIQIYCDFSGYSDIALGSAQVMGVKLMKNFRQPYFAKSISEFWQRWHISLSTWFRDYFYIPLGGNRVKKTRWILNLFMTFLISGLWHGANWTFVIWGALHGLYVVFFELTKKFWKRISAITKIQQFPKLETAIARTTVFSLVAFGWIFFRAANLSDALTIIQSLGSGWRALFEGSKDLISQSLNPNQSNLFFFPVQLFFKLAAQVTSEPRGTILIAILSLGFLLVVERKQANDNLMSLITKQPLKVRVVIYATFITLILILGTAYVGEQQAFIYFQF